MKIIKYIISDKNVPVLFSNELVHNEVVQNVKSAGFLKISYDKMNQRFSAKCFGESSSLKIIANANQDEQIIEEFLNGSKR